MNWFSRAISGALAASLGLWLLSIQPSWPQTGQLVQCNGAAQYDNTTNGSTQIITSRQNTGIYICGYTFFAAGTVNVKLNYGTGTACATGTTAVTPAYQFVAQTGIADSSSTFRGMFVPTGQNVCIFTSAGVATQAMVFYIQR